MSQETGTACRLIYKTALYRTAPHHRAAYFWLDLYFEVTQSTVGVMARLCIWCMPQCWVLIVLFCPKVLSINISFSVWNWEKFTLPKHFSCVYILFPFISASSLRMSLNFPKHSHLQLARNTKALFSELLPWNYKFIGTWSTPKSPQVTVLPNALAQNCMDCHFSCLLNSSLFFTTQFLSKCSNI